MTHASCLVIIATLALQPAPGAVTRPNNPAGPSASPNTQALPPITVTVTTPPKDAAQLDQERRDRDREIHTQERIRDFSAVLALVGVLQIVGMIFGLLYNYRAANAAKASADAASASVAALSKQIEQMDRIAQSQTADMQAAIGEAGRSASAMERVSKAMRRNTLLIRQNLRMARESNERQRLVSELHGRAYLTVAFLNMIEQNAAGMRFQPRAVILNKGNTPAYNVRSYTSTGVYPADLPPQFVFPVPVLPAEAPGSIIGPGMDRIVSSVAPESYPPDIENEIRRGLQNRLYLWGEVRYRDAFGSERVTKYACWFLQVGANQWMMFDVPGLNEAT